MDVSRGGDRTEEEPAFTCDLAPICGVTGGELAPALFPVPSAGRVTVASLPRFLAKTVARTASAAIAPTHVIPAAISDQLSVKPWAMSFGGMHGVAAISTDWRAIDATHVRGGRLAGG